MAARTLKVVGIIMILSALLDAAVLSIPAESSDILSRGWQLALTSQVVNRGIIPMVGTALLFTGFWVDSASGLGFESRHLWLDLRFWAILLANLLGLIYLLLVPLHLNNTRLELRETLALIERETAQQETQFQAQVKSEQFKTQIEQLKNVRRNQLTGLLQDEQRLQQILQSQETPELLKNILQQSKEDPQNLDKFLDQQAQALPTQYLTQIRTQKQQREKEARIQSRNASLQTGISSLLLAIGYITIGWTGLRTIGIIRPGRRQV